MNTYEEIEQAQLDETAKKILAHHKCGCEVCAHSAALCPATSSSLLLQTAELLLALQMARNYADFRKAPRTLQRVKKALADSGIDSEA